MPRRNYIIRRASNLSKESHIIAANLDRALLVVTLFSPVTAPEKVQLTICPELSLIPTRPPMLSAPRTVP